MRTISVKEAAGALGITPRAVTYRLEKGQLKGTLTKNEFGVPEWRIYPNKQILQGMNEVQAPSAEQTSFELWMSSQLTHLLTTDNQFKNRWD